jgi:hypothetical protein
MTNISDHPDHQKRLSEAQKIANKIKPFIIDLPYSRNFSQLNLTETSELFLGRETYKIKNNSRSLYPIIYYPSQQLFLLQLCDESLPVEILLEADADIPMNGVTTVNPLGLRTIFQHLGKQAKEFINTGILMNKSTTIDDYIFLYLSSSFLIGHKGRLLTVDEINKVVLPWINTGLPLEQIIFFLQLDNSDYTPETIEEYRYMPLDEIV